MHDVHYQAFGVYVAVDQRTVSERAAKAAELLQAVRDHKVARRNLRAQRRSVRRDQGGYTTAV